jgi:hypothetical protein
MKVFPPKCATDFERCIVIWRTKQGSKLSPLLQRIATEMIGSAARKGLLPRLHAR